MQVLHRISQQRHVLFPCLWFSKRCSDENPIPLFQPSSFRPRSDTDRPLLRSDMLPAGYQVSFNASSPYRFHMSLIIQTINKIVTRTTPISVYTCHGFRIRSPMIHTSIRNPPITFRNFSGDLKSRITAPAVPRPVGIVPFPLCPV